MIVTGCRETIIGTVSIDGVAGSAGNAGPGLFWAGLFWAGLFWAGLAACAKAIELVPAMQHAITFAVRKLFNFFDAIVAFFI